MDITLDDLFKEIFQKEDEPESPIADTEDLELIESIVSFNKINTATVDSIVSPLISDAEFEYPFLYIYPYEYTCEAERLRDITMADDSPEETRLPVVAKVNDSLVQVGRFSLDFANLYKLFQFKEYKMIIVQSDEEKFPIDNTDLLNTLVKEESYDEEQNI